MDTKNENKASMFEETNKKLNTKWYVEVANQEYHGNTLSFHIALDKLARSL